MLAAVSSKVLGALFPLEQLRVAPGLVWVARRFASRRVHGRPGERLEFSLHPLVAGVRQTYYVLEAEGSFFVMSFARSEAKPGAGYFNVVDAKAVDYVRENPALTPLRPGYRVACFAASPEVRPSSETRETGASEAIAAEVGR